VDLCSLAHVFTQKELIFPTRSVALDDVVSFSNTAASFANPAFCARTAIPDSIHIGLLPPRTTFHGIHLFAASLGGSWIAETIPHHLRGQITQTCPDASTDIIPIEDECFIATRYGHGTWGHWLGEILPLVAVAERLYPGRFRYATTFYGGETGWYGSRIVETFAAYGIAENRLFRMMQNRSYMFSAAHWITPAWSDHVMHPDVATVMRGSVRLASGSGSKRIALLSRGTRGRNVMNAEAITRVLRAYDYVPVDIEALSFSQQVLCFRHAESIFSVLGSGLAGLLFSPDAIKVVTIRPEQWLDRFFTGLMQLRRGRWADISGPTSGNNPMGDPFSVGDDDVASALQAMHGG
jgi:hypothetical protein